MPTIEISHEVNVECDCGKPLNCDIDRNGDIICEPCEYCLEQMRKDAYAHGKADWE